ncbi:MAG: hypothetical protein ACHQET_04715 [Chitinophagales bacterium]
MNTEIAGQQPRQRLIRFLAHSFSFIFHPLLIASYTMYFLIYVHPFAFTGFDSRTKLLRMLNVIIVTFAFPAFSTFLAWRLKFVKSLYLTTQKDRIIPYALSMFFYWWTWYVFRNLPETPPIAIRFLMGSFLAVCVGWFGNIFLKISMHAIAMGGLLGFALLFSFSDNYSSGLYLSLAILIAGMVCSSRLIVSDHTYREIWLGLLLGGTAQWLGWLFPVHS